MKSAVQAALVGEKKTAASSVSQTELLRIVMWWPVSETTVSTLMDEPMHPAPVESYCQYSSEHQ